MAKPWFSERYTDQLTTFYGAELALAVTAEPQQARISGTEFDINYVHLNVGEGSRPVFYVPGLTEGIVSQAPFVTALAAEGFDITLPDQNRQKILSDALTNHKDATYTQAVNYLSVLREAQLDKDGPVDVITHSYGSLIFERMARIALEKGYSSFKGSHVVMLAPAGIAKESPHGLAKRWLKLMLSEKNVTRDFQPTPEMLQAGAKNLAANLPRTLRETWEIASRRIDFKSLFAAGVGSLAVMSYAEDPLFGPEALAPYMKSVLEAGVTWSVPYSLQRLPNNKLRGGKDASHCDEQFNPSRVVNAVAQILLPARQKVA